MKRAPMAEDLGIHLSSKREEELFKWFLACLLLGKPIQRQVAERAFAALAAAGLSTPDAVLGAGWDELVRVTVQVAIRSQCGAEPPIELSATGSHAWGRGGASACFPGGRFPGCPRSLGSTESRNIG